MMEFLRYMDTASVANFVANIPVDTTDKDKARRARRLGKN